MDTISAVVVIMLSLEHHIIKWYNIVLLTLYYVHKLLTVYCGLSWAFYQYDVSAPTVKIELKP